MLTAQSKSRATRSAAAALALAFAAGGTASAQSITTLFTGASQGSAGGCLYFDVQTNTASSISIDSLDVNTAAAAGSSFGISVYTTANGGTWVGNDHTGPNPPWTLVAVGVGTAAGVGNHSHINLAASFTLAGNSTQGMVIQYSAPNQIAAATRYTNPGTTALQTFATSTDGNVTIKNSGLAQNVFGVDNAPVSLSRNFNGTIYYHVVGALGVCCNPNGTCTPSITYENCVASGGVFNPATTCAAANCPQPGACCNLDGTCTPSIQGAACTAGGGTFAGAGVTCAAANCPPGGACCKSDGSCVTFTSAACTANTGFWGGAGSNCGSVTCTGACCLPNSTCVPAVTWAACAQQGGIFRGSGTVCSGCPLEYSFDDGGIENEIGFTAAAATGWCTKFTSVAGQEILTHIRVAFGSPAAINGSPVTAYIWSDGTTPGNPNGATVLAQVSGTIQGAAQGPAIAAPLWVDFDIPDTLVATGGTFFAGVVMQNQAAGQFPCAEDTGSSAAGRCWIANAAVNGWPVGTFPTTAQDISTIAGLAGNWTIRVDGVSSAGTGACCKTDGSCVSNQTQAQCNAVGGNLSIGLTCAQANCPQPGRCCAADGTCSVTLQSACNAPNSTWTAATTCATTCPTGACCRADGTCDQQYRTACITGANAGNFAGVGVTCAAANCGQPGACCQSAGVCTSVAQFACLAKSGLFQGAGSACASSNCTPQYFIDDGTGELNIGFNATSVGILWLNRFQVANNHTQINQIDVAFGNQGIANGAAVTFYVWADPNGDGSPVDAGPPLATVSGTAVNVGTDVLNSYLLASPVTVGPNGTSFFVGAAFTGTVATGGIFPCRGDQFASQQHSWIAGNTTGTPVDPNLGAGTGLILIDTVAGLACNWMIRADSPPAPTTCYANCDNSTQPPVLNVGDFTCFLQKFAAGDPYANCDNSTQPPVLNVGDFTCFLQKFAAGCS